MLLTDALLRIHHHSWPFQLQPSSFPPFNIEERFRVQNDGALKGNFAAKSIHHEGDPACHPHSTCSVFPVGCSPTGSQLVRGKTWFVYKQTWWGKPVLLCSWCQGWDFQIFFLFVFVTEILFHTYVLPTLHNSPQKHSAHHLLLLEGPAPRWVIMGMRATWASAFAH